MRHLERTKEPRWTAENIPTQRGRLAIVTDAGSGVGWHAALELARAEAEVILTTPTAAEGSAALSRIRQQVPRASVRNATLDLADLESVRVFAGRVNREAKVDLLINHVSFIKSHERKTTRDGFELQFGACFLGPFALTGLLLPVLLRSQSPRVTTVSSSASGMGRKRIHFEDIQGWTRYDAWSSYCQARLAALTFAVELGRRCKDAWLPLLSNAAHPGHISSEPTPPAFKVAKATLSLLSQSESDAALPILRAATAPDARASSYYAPSRRFGLRGHPVVAALPSPATHQSDAQKLWWMAEQLTRVKFKRPWMNNDLVCGEGTRSPTPSTSLLQPAGYLAGYYRAMAVKFNEL